MLTAVLALVGIASLSGLLLGLAASRLRTADEPVAAAIDALLPQSQCAQCGYAGCRPYAEAIAAGRAQINQCPPGGEALIRELAALLDREPSTLDPAYGVDKPRQVAVVREQDCIGCALCLAACPVDAIVGSARRMHTVISSQCTGCELCLPPCPVDCIDMETLAEPFAAPTTAATAPCIRCGDCTPVCPRHLEPHTLYAFSLAGEHRKAAAANLSACIECGLCERACPAGIPLVAYFQHAKTQLRQAQHNRVFAQRARERFERREARLTHARQQRDSRLSQQHDRLRAAEGEHARRAEIAAAVTRARQRKTNRRAAPQHD